MFSHQVVVALETVSVAILSPAHWLSTTVFIETNLLYIFFQFGENILLDMLIKM